MKHLQDTGKAQSQKSILSDVLSFVKQKKSKKLLISEFFPIFPRWSKNRGKWEIFFPPCMETLTNSLNQQNFCKMGVRHTLVKKFDVSAKSAERPLYRSWMIPIGYIFCLSHNSPPTTHNLFIAIPAWHHGWTELLMLVSNLPFPPARLIIL